MVHHQPEFKPHIDGVRESPLEFVSRLPQMVTIWSEMGIDDWPSVARGGDKSRGVELRLLTDPPSRDSPAIPAVTTILNQTGFAYRWHIAGGEMHEFWLDLFVKAAEGGATIGGGILVKESWKKLVSALHGLKRVFDKGEVTIHRPDGWWVEYKLPPGEAYDIAVDAIPDDVHRVIVEEKHIERQWAADGSGWEVSQSRRYIPIRRLPKEIPDDEPADAD